MRCVFVNSLFSLKSEKLWLDAKYWLLLYLPYDEVSTHFFFLYTNLVTNGVNLYKFHEPRVPRNNRCGAIDNIFLLIGSGHYIIENLQLILLNADKFTVCVKSYYKLWITLYLQILSLCKIPMFGFTCTHTLLVWIYAWLYIYWSFNRVTRIVITCIDVQIL